MLDTFVAAVSRHTGIPDKRSGRSDRKLFELTHGAPAREAPAAVEILDKSLEAAQAAFAFGPQS
jgi:hypothetical protein